MLLQAQGFGMPTAAAWDAEELSDFCASADFGIGFVPTDALLFPPQNNYFDADTEEEEALPMKPGFVQPGAHPYDAAPTTLASDRGGQYTSPNFVSDMGSGGPDNFMSSRPLGPPPHSGNGAGPSPYESPPSPRGARPSSSRGQHAPDERDGTRGRSSFGDHHPRYSPTANQGNQAPAHKDPDFMKTPPRASGGGGGGGESSSSKGISSRPRSQPRNEDSRDASRPVPRTVYGDADDVLRQEKVEAPWVLIFNKGREDEGMYTLQGRETPEKGSGTFVMAFERQEEASRFSMLLQAQGFGMPTAAAWDAEELSDFCASADFGIGFVPTDALLFPPEDNYFDADAFATHKLKEEAEDARGTEGAEVRAGLDRLFEL